MFVVFVVLKLRCLASLAKIAKIVIPRRTQKVFHLDVRSYVEENSEMSQLSSCRSELDLNRKFLIPV